jgi:hypothetical protein
MHKRNEKCIHNFDQDNSCEKNLENLAVGGRIILRRILKRRCERVDWIHLSQHRVQTWYNKGKVVPVLSLTEHHTMKAH